MAGWEDLRRQINLCHTRSTRLKRMGPARRPSVLTFSSLQFLPGPPYMCHTKDVCVRVSVWWGGVISEEASGSP